jgi:DHA3 family multidrug efflux protein-like MFS transporter
MKLFHKLLIYALLVSSTNNFVWFALTYWAYLQTKSVVATGIVGGIFLVATAVSGFGLGAIVDHYKKKQVLIASGLTTFSLFAVGSLVYHYTPKSVFTYVESPLLWVFAGILLLGVIAGSILAIAIPTMVTFLVPVKEHDKANGLFGTVMGVSFAITSLASGLVLGNLGMGWVLFIALVCTILSLLSLIPLPIEEQTIIHTHKSSEKNVDIRGTIRVIQKIPGMFGLIFFTTFNNFVGGVFMALMDAYGLSLVSVQTWGILWGVLSFGFILSGIYIAKRGLGNNPLRTLFVVNIMIWIVCIFFTIQASIILLAIGSFIWMFLFPFVEASEQTIIQKVVPVERQGRVFGFAQSVEQAASPLTAFLIGPITQYVFIPFMTTGEGVSYIGGWFGTGPGRGIALVFILAGIIGLIVTLITMRSSAYRLLSERYAKDPEHSSHTP